MPPKPSPTLSPEQIKKIIEQKKLNPIKHCVILPPLDGFSKRNVFK